MTHYICVGPCSWGKSEDAGGAVARAKRAWPNLSSKHMPYDLYEVEPDAFVNEHGDIIAMTPPKKIREVRFVGTQRVVKIVKEKFDAAPLSAL